MSASQGVLVGVGFAKGTGRCRPFKVLVGDGLSGAHGVISPPKARGGRGMQRQKQEIKGQQMLKQKVEDQEVKDQEVKEVRSPNQEVLDQRGQDLSWRINR